MQNFFKVSCEVYLIEAWWHIYVSVNLVIIGSGKGLAPVCSQAITWNNVDSLSIRSGYYA